MNNCEVCGEESRLFEVITDDRIKSVCRLCARRNNWILINKPTTDQIKSESSFYDIGDKIIRHEPRKKDSDTEKLEEELQEIVSKKIKAGEYEDLIDNFHWIIQHSRRMKKISQKQLAEAIAEPEVIVSMAEKAELPEDYEKLDSPNLYLMEQP